MDDASHRRRNRQSRACLLEVLCASAVVIITAYRLYLARSAHFAGHADPSFYYTLSQNLRAGRGFVIDYVWHFMPAPDTLTHYGLDYWMPLPSIIMALSPIEGVSGAVTATVVWTSTLAPLTWLLARRLSAQRWVGPVAALVVLLMPSIARMSIRTDSAAYAAVGTTAALAAALWAPGRRRGWVVAGVAVGLAVLARNDGVLLTLPLVTAVVVGEPAGRRLRALAGAAVGGIAAISPLFMANLWYTGQLVVSQGYRLLFMTSYTQLYAYRSQPSWQSFADQQLGAAMQVRWAAAVRGVEELWVEQGVWLGALFGGLVVLGWMLRRREATYSAAAGPTGSARSLWPVPASLAVAYIVGHALLTPHLSANGSFSRTLPSLLPPLVVAALDGWGELIHNLRRWLSGFAEVSVVVAGSLAVLALVVNLASQLGAVERVTIASANASGDAAVPMGQRLEAEARRLGRHPVVMTRYPWQVSEVTGYPTVSLPSDGLASVRSVINRYGVTHLVAPADRPDLWRLSSTAGPAGPIQVINWAGSSQRMR